MPRTVYRIEHAVDNNNGLHKRGPYYFAYSHPDAVAKKICSMTCPTTQAKTKWFTMGWCDGWIFACLSMDIVEKYFGGSIWRYMREQGFILSLYSVPDYAIELDDEGEQCAFNIREAALIASHVDIYNTQLLAA